MQTADAFEDCFEQSHGAARFFRKGLAGTRDVRGWLYRAALGTAFVVGGCAPSTVFSTQEIGPAEVDGPDEWYPLDDPAAIGRDRSGHSLHALPIGITVVPDPTRGHAAQFDGGALVIVPQMKQDFTIALWLKTNQLGPAGTTWSTGPRIVDADVPGVHLDFALSMALDKLAMGTGTPGNASVDSTALNSQRSVADGTWHHVAIMRDGQQGTWQIFIDGVADASRAGATGPLTIPKTITLGTYGTTNPVVPGLQAELSNVLLYSRVLSVAAISFLATQ